jgi:hypothetical protein
LQFFLIHKSKMLVSLESLIQRPTMEFGSY